MSRFGMIIEDPCYDEDGVLIDEDSDEGDWQDDKFVTSLDLSKEAPEACYIQDCDPYSTINS